MSQTNSDAGIGKRITRYSSILSISGIACKLLLLVYTVFAVKILGQEQFGRIEYFIEMGIIFSVLLDFGLEQTVTREIARRRDQIHTILFPLLAYRIIVSLAGVFIMSIVLKLFAREGHTWTLILCSTTYFFAISVMMIIRALIRGFEWFAIEGLANITDKIIHISSALLLLFIAPKLPLILLCYTAGMLGGLAIYLYMLIHNFGFTFQRFSLQWGLEWQKSAFLIGLTGSCIMLMHREDTAMVNWIRGDAETGLYRAPYRFLEGLFLLPQVITIPAYPIFSKLYHEKKTFSQTATDLLRGLMIISFPIAVGGTILADDMISFLMPGLDKGGGMVFRILLWSLPFIYANFLLGTILVATDRQKLNFYASLSGLLSNALFNIPAIYYLGAYGACWATIVSQGLYTMIMVYYAREFLTLVGIQRYVSIFFSCAVMGLSIYVTPLPWYVEIITGGAVYSVILLLTKGISYADLQHIKNIAAKNTPRA